MSKSLYSGVNKVYFRSYLLLNIVASSAYTYISIRKTFCNILKSISCWSENITKLVRKQIKFMFMKMMMTLKATIFSLQKALIWKIKPASNLIQSFEKVFFSLTCICFSSQTLFVDIFLKTIFQIMFTWFFLKSQIIKISF